MRIKAMSDRKIDISIVVAAYNEEAIIANNLRLVADELSSRPEMKWEILCVNDGSNDRTGDIMDAFASEDPRVRVIHHCRNFGQGRAIRSAFDQCRGEYIITLDADLSYGSEYIYKLIDALHDNNVEIALVSPYTKGGSVRNVPFFRRFLSRYANLYLGKMSNYSISTSTCVVRAYRSEVIDSMFLTSDGMELQLEILMKASMMGFHVCEIPARLQWPDHKASTAFTHRESKMRIKQTIGLCLLMGWLGRPARIFVVLSIILVCMGVWLTKNTVQKFFSFLAKFSDEGIVLAISHSLREVVNDYYYGLFFACILLLSGFLICAFSLLMLQNKYYFEELYRLGQYIRRPERDPISNDDAEKETNRQYKED
jgi:glycosyltransferase involved in cell wall biosynthesis